jgi:hypothetical protein
MQAPRQAAKVLLRYINRSEKHLGRLRFFDA